MRSDGHQPQRLPDAPCTSHVIDADSEGVRAMSSERIGDVHLEGFLPCVAVEGTICDAFATSKLVDVDLSDNAIGEQGIGACRTVLSMRSLERLALCNNGLSADTLAQVADILTYDEDGTGCIASKLTKIHFHNNMSGEGG